ncbi:hypothetical protein MNBD_GAMMA26-1945 [hydrothermal vent metagenome]|uniref:ATP-cone domain-containing protein n=1 Tax=hydrothermal vent metagenome TaxID=652676 RepID=A0A3B1B958_9ZZZZ
MAKTLIIDLAGHKQTPFLRGILTRSLQAAGLSFEEAFNTATSIRNELSDTLSISTTDLRAAIAQHLSQTYGDTVLERYQSPSHTPATILVERTNLQAIPFSRGELRRSLECSGLAEDEAMTIVAKIYDYLVSKGIEKISSGEMGQLTYRYLRRELGASAAKRYLVWTDFRHGNRPLLILIGGTPGCGKSTMSTELASKLDIIRTQSTDMLREVMRMMLPNRLLPVLHTSSFDAWKALPSPTESLTDRDSLLVEGYLTQVDLLSVAGEAVLQRALKERVSIILEGVHMHPSFLQNIPQDTDAIVVPIMLSVSTEELLRQRFKGRGQQAANRRAERYLENFDAIWRLQKYLIGEAKRSNISIIHNDEKELALRQVMQAIIKALSKDFKAKPEDVFI